jgi:hypothetical protein
MAAHSFSNCALLEASSAANALKLRLKRNKEIKDNIFIVASLIMDKWKIQPQGNKYGLCVYALRKALSIVLKG